MRNTSTWSSILGKDAMVMARRPVSTQVTPPGLETLAQLRESVGNCQLCKLCSTRTQIVFGEGSESAQLMLIGDAPGESEDQSGRPFVGPAGQLLDKMIEAIGLTREQVYFANVTKCRPPADRNPDFDEIESCRAFLIRQIRALNPSMILTLGDVATQTLLKSELSFSQLRGELLNFEDARLIPTHHPSYLLKNPSAKKEAWVDLKLVAQYFGLELRKRQTE
jgi:uracil-DNA glycosylase family 4